MACSQSSKKWMKQDGELEEHSHCPHAMVRLLKSPVGLVILQLHLATTFQNPSGWCWPVSSMPTALLLRSVRKGLLARNGYVWFPSNAEKFKWTRAVSSGWSRSETMIQSCWVRGRAGYSQKAPRTNTLFPERGFLRTLHISSHFKHTVIKTRGRNMGLV